MPDLAIVLACYALFMIARIRFVVRGLRAPFYRGSGWLFDRRLRDEAAWRDGAAGIVQAYWLRMALAFAIDLPILWSIFGARQYVASVLLIVLGSVIQELNQFANVRAVMRRAEAMGLVGRQEAPRALVLSLTPRRLRDYMRLHVELTIAACNLVGLAWLALIEWRFGMPRGLWALYGVPFFLLYVQLGALLVKLIAIQWRNPLPAEFAQRAARASEAVRWHRAMACDATRAGAALCLLFWPIKVAIADAEKPYVVAVFFACAVVAATTVFLRKEQRRRELDTLVSGAPPAPMPEIPTRRWPVCLAPASPLPILASDRGWSINIAHRQTQAAVLYVAGFATLAARLALG